MKVYIKKFDKNCLRSRKHNTIIKILLDKLMMDFSESINEKYICYEENGKPFIKNKSIYFNISYSDNIGVLAISNENVGIDIEKIKKYDEKLVNNFYSKEELRYLKKSYDRNYEYTKLWTYKEAYLKYQGTGINDNFKNLNFIQENKYVSNVKFKTINYEDYVITICCKDLNLILEEIGI